MAYKDRNKTREVIEYKQNLEENLMKLQEKLISFKYKHRKYRPFIVEDSKKRVINAPYFSILSLGLLSKEISFIRIFKLKFKIFKRLPL